MRLLIDGDIVAFRFAASAQTTVDWEDGTPPLTVAEELYAKEAADHFILNLIKDTEAKDYKVCLSAKNNFRYSVDATYKSNRKHLVEPILRQFLLKHLETSHPSIRIETLEADDVMGVLGSLNPDKVIIATIDKDLLQIPTTVYNWKNKTFTRPTLEEADFFFYKQILKGDSTDGYSGCPGIGEKKATALLEKTPRAEWWKEIVKLFRSKDLTEKDAITQARLARILRVEDYDFKNKKVILWKPTEA